jgi:superfamily II DNA/RNA helicase
MPTGTGKTKIIELMAAVNHKYEEEAKPFKVFYCTSTRVLARDMYERLDKFDHGNVGLCFGKMTLAEAQVFAITIMTYEKLIALMKYGTSEEATQWTFEASCNCIVLDEYQNVRDYTRGKAIEYIIEYAMLKKITIVCLSGSIEESEVQALATAFKDEALLLYSNIKRFTSTVRFVNKKALTMAVVNLYLTDNWLESNSTIILFTLSKKSCYKWAVLLYNALKTTGTLPIYNQRIIPVAPYNISFDCSNEQEVKLDIITLARYGIGVFWSDTCEGYNHFFSDMFKTNENDIRIMITTTVMAEGIDYPNVQNVFIYAPDNIKFYVANKMISRSKLLQMVGRTGRNRPGTVLMSSSLYNLYMTEKDTSLFNLDAIRDDVNLSMLHFESEFNDKCLSMVEIHRKFRTIYEHANNEMRRTINGIYGFQTDDTTTRDGIIRYTIAEKIDIRLTVTFMALRDYIELFKNDNRISTYDKSSMIVFVDLLLVSMLAANDIAGLGTNEQMYEQWANLYEYEELYSVDPCTYVGKDRILRTTDSLEDPVFNAYRKNVAIIDHFYKIFNAEYSVVYIRDNEVIKDRIATLWRIMIKIGATAHEIRNIWRYATCMLSLLSQRRTPWNYVFMDEAPLEGLLLFRLTYEKNANLISQVISDLFLPKAICAVFHKMEQCLLQRANEAIQSDRIEPVLRTQNFPLAGQLLKLDKKGKLELMSTTEIRTQMSSNKYNLYSIVKLTLNPEYDFKRFETMYLITSSMDLVLNNNYFSWILSRNVINGSDTIISLDKNADERIMQLLGTSMAMNFFSRLTKHNRNMLKSK